MDTEMLTINTDIIRMDTGMQLIDNEPIDQIENDSKTAGRGISEMNNPYIGKERRLAERRIEASERRELVRYEINKAPRRTGQDRRKINGWAEFSEYKLM
ncbi:MAG: hypothetical protein AB8B89_08095 [Gammaproteobacteria bacterium]